MQRGAKNHFNTKLSNLIKIATFGAGSVNYQLCNFLQKTYCWKCAIYKTNSKGQLSNTASETRNVCEKTQDQINDYEQENRVTQRVFKGSNYQANTIQSMRCTR